ncbi:molybdate ABC transporter substrate-binding protein [Mariniluteicoccus flavus]
MRTPVLLLACVVALLASACTPAPATSLRVYAAASLQQVFTELAELYSRETGTSVELSFGGSADLLTQLTNGAPGDVLATADESTMGRARTAKLVTDEPVVVATNTLVIAVQPGNPRGVRAYADLARPGLALVRCAPQVPCGAAAAKAELAAGVATKPVSEENSVSDVLGKVTSGQADAGLVYATDVARSQGKAEAVRFPEAAGVVNRYPIAPLAASHDSARSKAFAAFVAGPKGRQTFARAGFGQP